MKLYNPKTKNETGFDFVLNSLHILSPYGKKQLKALTAFEPGKEEELKRELDKLEMTLGFLQKEPDLFSRITEIFALVKDNTFTIERSQENTLSVVELFEVKTLLLQMEALNKHYKAAQAVVPIPQSFLLEDLRELLDILDPGGERVNTFYIYDSFSKKLGQLRKEKRNLELDLRRVQKEIKCRLEDKYKIIMTPKFEHTVSKQDKVALEKALSMEELLLSQEDYMSAVFTLKPTEDQDKLKASMEKINHALEEEELKVRERLSEEISSYKDELLENCRAIGEADFTMAKAAFALKHNCVKPEITQEHQLIIHQGRQLLLEDILEKRGKDYKPVSIELHQGVSSITGANMGGKTVTLKMVGQCALMAQQGFFIPAAYGKIGLSTFVHLLVGDSQNLKRGLSSFGSEMEELKDILDKSKERALLLIDEIASGTNPVEGRALTKSVIRYLSDKPYISLLTTHFDRVSNESLLPAGKSRNLQVKGLTDADFKKLSREIKYANRLERIEIIGKYMDYSLTEVAEDKEVPKDALNIAAMLGLNREIIDEAKKYMEDH